MIKISKDCTERIIYLIISSICIWNIIVNYPIPEDKSQENQKLNYSLSCYIKTAEIKKSLIKCETKIENETVEERKERILNDPEARIIDLVPYLIGNRNDMIEIVAHMLRGETRGSELKFKVYHVLMVIDRDFTKGYTDELGNLESVIMKRNQFSCVNDGSFYQIPDEDCYYVAKEILSGNIIFQELQDVKRGDFLYSYQIEEVCDPFEK